MYTGEVLLTQPSCVRLGAVVGIGKGLAATPSAVVGAAVGVMGAAPVPRRSYVLRLRPGRGWGDRGGSRRGCLWRGTRCPGRRW
eukprot:4800902-Alexandrium_andersonii.AAC.1